MSDQQTHYAVVPQTEGVGGMVSFRHKFSAGLQALGHAVHSNPTDHNNRGVLVIGGTRNLNGLRRAQQMGIPIVQRLNGRNWLHKKTTTSVRHYLRAEYGNLILNIIRNRIASAIIYQSEFAKAWWEREAGSVAVPAHVIHNGVSLRSYSPAGTHDRPDDRIRVLMVEGSLAGGYEQGLTTGVGLVERLDVSLDVPVELSVVGQVSKRLRSDWDERSKAKIDWVGPVPREAIPRIDRSAHLLFSADINAACPNAVIEAMACGLPIVAFNTGALSELVPSMGGRLANYGGDPWNLDPPNLDALAACGLEVLTAGRSQRLTARGWAEHRFGLDEMILAYLDVLNHSS